MNDRTTSWSKIYFDHLWQIVNTSSIHLEKKGKTIKKGSNKLKKKDYKIKKKEKADCLDGSSALAP